MSKAIKNIVNFTKDLNKQQLKVVEHLEGKILVLAGAGTGKTKIITYSVAKLIKEGVSPSEIMLITFTNKASREMINRIKELLGKLPFGMVAGTFHSVAHRNFLRKFKKKINYGSYEIMDVPKSRDLIKSCIYDACKKEMLNDPNFNPKNEEEELELFKQLQKQYPKPRYIQEIISSSANCNRTIENVINWRFQDFVDYKEQINEIMKRYKDKKIKYSKFDFDDLLFFWEKLLDYDDVKQFAKRFKYIFVDEYQDTNYIQNSIIYKLSKLNESEKHCLLVVGDDAQSIYAFRGANITNFLNFEENFKNVKKFKITTNYRSCPEVLDLTNNSISHNENQFKKEMTANNPAHIKPQFVYANSNVELIDFIVNKIKKYHSEGKSYDDIAVLFRSLKVFSEEGYHIRRFQTELAKEQIPFEVRGGKSFFEKAHIRDLFAFLSFRYDPKSLFAGNYWERITKYIEGLGKSNSLKIYDSIIKKKRTPLQILRSEINLKREIAILRNNKIISRFGNNVLKSITQMIDKLLNLKSNNIEQMIFDLFNFLPFKEKFEALYKSGEDDQSFEDRIADIGLIASTGRDFRMIGSFLNHFTLNESDYNRKKSTENNVPKVIISTIHQAKGLEWENVFIPFLFKYYFPNAYSLAKLEDREEERRVFYVAMTRAKKNLVLLSSKLNDKSENYELSTFVDELDDSLYDQINL